MKEQRGSEVTALLCLQLRCLVGVGVGVGVGGLRHALVVLPP